MPCGPYCRQGKWQEGPYWVAQPGSLGSQNHLIRTSQQSSLMWTSQIAKILTTDHRVSCSFCTGQSIIKYMQCPQLRVTGRVGWATGQMAVFGSTEDIFSNVRGTSTFFCYYFFIEIHKYWESRFGRGFEKNPKHMKGSPGVWVSGCFLGYRVLWLQRCHYLLFADHALDSWLSVDICGPIDQIENGKEHRKDDAGDFVNLADTVVGLGLSWDILHVGGLGRTNDCWGWGGTRSSALGDGRELSVLGQVDGIGGPHDVEGGAGFLCRDCWCFLLGARKVGEKRGTKQKISNSLYRTPSEAVGRMSHEGS